MLFGNDPSWWGQVKLTYPMLSSAWSRDHVHNPDDRALPTSGGIRSLNGRATDGIQSRVIADANCLGWVW